MEQKYIYPDDIFDRPGDSPIWTCARTRPRWEKKFSRWLTGQKLPHFLPTYTKESISHRKRRVAELALFPGHVFVRGDYNKDDFKNSGCVAYLLKTRADGEAQQLHSELHNIWIGLMSGVQALPITEPIKGQKVEILDGPLMGAIGTFTHKGKNNNLVLWIDILGAGASIEIEQGCKTRTIEE